MASSGPRGAHRQHRPLRPRRPLTLALALLAPALVAACAGRPADAVTTLHTGGAGTVVVAPDGRVSAAVDGEQLAVGDAVRTAGASAALRTGGRVTTLGPSSELVVAGRSRYLLDDGTVVVDHRAGPDATVVAGPVTVDDLGRTAVRVERGFAVRVALYDGGGAQVAAGGQTLRLSALHEADVPGSVLPATAPPLSLRDDALDVVAAPALVALDRALDRGAAAVDGPAGEADAATFAARTTTVVPAVDLSTGTLADRVLPAAMAGARGGDVSQTYATAWSLRAAGASWGVVADLVGAPLAGIDHEVAVLLGPAGTGGTLTGSGPVAVAAGSGSVLDGVLGGSASAAPAPVTGDSAGDGAGPSAAPVTGTSVDPVPTLPTVVDIGGGHTPAPSVSVPVSLPVTVPTPTASASSLVGGLLGTVLGLVVPSTSSSAHAVSVTHP